MDIIITKIKNKLPSDCITHYLSVFIVTFGSDDAERGFNVAADKALLGEGRVQFVKSTLNGKVDCGDVFFGENDRCIFKERDGWEGETRTLGENEIEKDEVY